MQIISSGLPRLYTKCGPSQESTKSASVVAPPPRTRKPFPPACLGSPTSSQTNLSIAGSAFKSSIVALVPAFAASLRPLCSYLIFFEVVSVGGVSVKRQIVLLICIVLLGPIRRPLFSLELGAIGSRSIKPSWVFVVAVVAVPGGLEMCLTGSKALVVLSLSIKFGLVGLVGIARLVVRRLLAHRFIVDRIGGF